MSRTFKSLDDLADFGHATRREERQARKATKEDARQAARARALVTIRLMEGNVKDLRGKFELVGMFVSARRAEVLEAKTPGAKAWAQGFLDKDAARRTALAAELRHAENELRTARRELGR